MGLVGIVMTNTTIDLFASKKHKYHKNNKENIFDGDMGKTLSPSKRSGQEYINVLLESVNILDVMEMDYGMSFKVKTKGEYLSHCPFPDHRDTSPSFFVNPSKGLFQCYGCGRAGTIIHFIQHIEGLKFHEALRRLAISTGIECITDEDKMKYAIKAINEMVDEFVNSNKNNILPAGMNEIEYMFAIADRLKTYEKTVTLNDEEKSWIESIYYKVDKMEEIGDFQGLTNLWNELIPMMQKRIG